DGRQPVRQQQRDVTVVRVEPVVTRTHGVGDADLRTLVTAAWRDERALALPLQAAEALVGQTTEEHVAVHADQLLCWDVEFERCQPLTRVTDYPNRLVGERLEALRFANHAWLPADESPCQTATIACTRPTIASVLARFRNGTPIAGPCRCPRLDWKRVTRSLRHPPLTCACSRPHRG